jgi:hypothetical protein
LASDPLLHPFLRAKTSAESEQHLQRLLEVEAGPVMRRILKRKAQASSPRGNLAANELEDVYSSVREELIRQLLMLRSGEKTKPLANFRAYTGAIAYATWAEHLRRAYPARSKLADRLRYLLEGRTDLRGLVLWSGESGERWCGLERWRGTTPAESSANAQRLYADPAATALDAFGDANFKTMPLPLLVRGLFTWLEQPIPLRQLVDVIAELLEISDRKETLDHAGSVGAAVPVDLADPAPSAIDALKWNEYLHWLWTESERLSLPQRIAFLLHSPVLREFELSGIGSIGRIAKLLEMPPETLAGIWKDIPLGDLEIGARLERERQQVINLRRVARDRLGAAWKEWIK